MENKKCFILFISRIRGESVEMPVDAMDGITFMHAMMHHFVLIASIDTMFTYDSRNT